MIFKSGEKTKFNEKYNYLWQLLFFIVINIIIVVAVDNKSMIFPSDNL